MKIPTRRLPLCTKKWRLATLSLVLPMTGVLVGCIEGQNAKHPTQTHALHQQDVVAFKPLATFYDPSHGVAQGQKNALTHFMSKRWQLKSVNHIPMAQDVVVDLRDFANGKGRIDSDCDQIFFELDTQKIMAGTLSVTNIERTVGDCQDNTGDELMRLFGDLHSFYHQDGKLVLLSLKDKIELVSTK